jgi:hypothetical protein
VSALDWPLLARGALWVSGCSLVLAAWSQAAWWASAHHEHLRPALARSTFVAPFSLGLALIAIALSWGAVSLWERLIWIVLGVFFAVSFVRSLKS